MSVSSINSGKTDEDFIEVEFRPVPESPAEPEQQKEETPVNGDRDLKEEPEKKTERETSPKPSAKNGWGAAMLDAFLIILLLAIIGFGGYYLKQELDRYRVPSAMEIALRENHNLSVKRESLQADYYHADEQIHMRQTLARLDSQLADIQDEIAKLENSIEDQRNNILALQHEIRQADADSRSIARSLLPGMAIGTATTTTGKSIQNAVIYRMKGKHIDLRSPEGQVRVLTKDLVKDSLPPMARYAFGLDDLVDMTDFETQSGKNDLQPVPPSTKRESRDTQDQTSATRTGMDNADYDPDSGAPIVNTEAGSNLSSGSSATAAPSSGSSQSTPWIAPTGDMPL